MPLGNASRLIPSFTDINTNSQFRFYLLLKEPPFVDVEQLQEPCQFMVRDGNYCHYLDS